MISRISSLLLLFLLPLTCTADESIVYESFFGVNIGRVFLSQSQRDSLDERRLLRPQQDGAGGLDSTGSAAATRKLESAGFIIGRNGRSKVWKDGDFVDARGSRASSMSFPGDVTITRHAEAETSATHADAAASSDGGTADDDG